MSLWMLPSALVVLLMTAGVLGAHLEVLTPGNGFYTFLAGTALALISSLSLGGAAAFASATGRLWRPRAVRGALLPLLATLMVVIPRLRRFSRRKAGKWRELVISSFGAVAVGAGVPGTGGGGSTGWGVA